MRAVTLTQPYAGLVASGRKLIENRRRGVVRWEDFSEPFAIHASRKIDEGVYRTIRSIAPELFLSGADGDVAGRPDPSWYGLTRVTRAVIGVASIERAVVFEGDNPRTKVVRDMQTGELVDLGDQARWFFGRIGYVLRDVRSIARPVPCRGHQSSWHVSDVVADEVMAQVRASPAPSDRSPRPRATRPTA